MKKQDEIWRDIKGYEGLYQVSTKGRVKSLLGRKERILKPTPQSRGYLQVTLFKDGIQNWRTVHRLVMETFVPNPENLPVINHIDENPLNNELSNLEWCSYSDNATHNGVNERRMKKVYQYDNDMNLIKVYKSAKHAVKEVEGTVQTLIGRVARGAQNTHAGYRWSYEFTMISNEMEKEINEFAKQLAA